MGSASNEYPFFGSEENQFSLGIGMKSGLRGPSAAGFAELGWVTGAKLAIINPATGLLILPKSGHSAARLAKLCPGDGNSVSRAQATNETDDLRELLAVIGQKHEPEKRVQNQSNLSVLRVFLSDLALPTVPHNQQDTLTYVAWQS